MRPQRIALGDRGGTKDPLIEGNAALAEIRAGLARRAVAEYTPLVDSIISRRSTDVWQIEHTLDGLLDFCFDPEALVLFKRLCRHYYFIDRAAAADYVRFYREMWDSEPERAGGENDLSVAIISGLTLGLTPGGGGQCHRAWPGRPLGLDADKPDIELSRGRAKGASW
jgi:hypothetical protein